MRWARLLSLPFSKPPLLSAPAVPQAGDRRAGDPEVIGTRALRRGPAATRTGAISPGDEEDDAQRVGGDGEDIESERGPEGDEGATEEHGRGHDDRISQSREPEGTAEFRALS